MTFEVDDQSLVIELPLAVLEQLGIGEGDQVSLFQMDDGKIVLEKVYQPKNNS